MNSDEQQLEARRVNVIGGFRKLIQREKIHRFPLEEACYYLHAFFEDDRKIEQSWKRGDINKEQRDDAYKICLENAEYELGAIRRVCKRDWIHVLKEIDSHNRKIAKSFREVMHDSMPDALIADAAKNLKGFLDDCEEANDFKGIYSLGEYTRRSYVTINRYAPIAAKLQNRANNKS
jgi:hypothetical protein